MMIQGECFSGDSILNEGSGLKIKAIGDEVHKHNKDYLEG